MIDLPPDLFDLLLDEISSAQQQPARNGVGQVQVLLAKTLPHIMARFRQHLAQKQSRIIHYNLK